MIRDSVHLAFRLRGRVAERPTDHVLHGLQIDEVVGLPTQLVQDHGSRIAQARDGRNPHTLPLQAGKLFNKQIQQKPAKRWNHSVFRG